MIDINGYVIKESKRDLSLNKYYEGVFTQGNGYMHVRGSYEELLGGSVQDSSELRRPDNVTIEKKKPTVSKWGTFIPGVVGKHPFLQAEMINLPYFFAMQITGKDKESGHKERLGDLGNVIADYERTLDMKTGVLKRTFTWEVGDSAVRLTFSRWISMADKHLAIQRLDVSCLKGKISLNISGDTDPKVTTNGFNHFKEVNITEENNVKTFKVATNGGDIVTIRSFMPRSGEVTLDAGMSTSIEKIVEVYTSRDIDGYKPLDNFDLDVDKLFKNHCEVWNKKWEAADVKVNDDKLQSALRFSIYHLIRSCNEDDPRVAICAKGHAGEGYFGRYFWDTEINMLPFFIKTNPKAARNLLMFRYITLPGAKRNAAKYGYSGARYAWESSVTGDDECANWQYADHEIHVTADIVYAMMNYVNATGDEEFLRDYGLEIMIETAKYWIERVDKRSDGSYDLLGVMGPDEYLPMTDNNAYTNRMVKYSLEMTLRYAEKYKEKAENLGFDKSLEAKVKDVYENLKLPYNKDTVLIKQCEDWDRYADLDFNVVWKDRNDFFARQISQE
ncbi:MAG: glycoside hydrolase family 65 protein, partial [Lachnospiraceae bacterium]|nr:glycoside hydrolase family 65 protein [Lachnospiraceae bacterium]